MIAGHAERSSCFDHAHDEPKHVRNLQPAIDQIAQENGLAPFRVPGSIAVRGGAVRALFDFIPEPFEQRSQFVKTPVHIADDVERPVFVLEVIPEPLPLDDRSFNLFGRRKLVDVAEALTLQVAL